MSIPGFTTLKNSDKSLTYGDLVVNSTGGPTPYTSTTLISSLSDKVPYNQTTTGEILGYTDFNKKALFDKYEELIQKPGTVWSYNSESDPLGKKWSKPYEGMGYVGLNPSDYPQGTLIVDSGDYPNGVPSPMLEAIIAGRHCLFVGQQACEDARELVILEKRGEFYGDSLFYMLTPRCYYVGDYNCTPCDMWCCLRTCRKMDDGKVIRVHKEYWRVWAFATVIYDIKGENRKYESINSNVVVVRSNTIPLPFDIGYIPPGATHVRYWSKNEIMFCEPDNEEPCPYDCGTELKIGGDDEFFLRDEVEIPKELRKEVGVL